MAEFEGVVAALGKALDKRGYEALTPVQKAVIATDYVDRDLLVSAQTGSGKTVAFGMAIAPTLLQGEDVFPRSKTPLALVVAPTRELALQVRRELEWLYEPTKGLFASCVGGMDMRTERRALSQGAHIVVGTPGRLRDHIERGSLDMNAMRAVVLDEADEMLDMGFRDDLEYILGAAPEGRRTLMFSATVPRMIATLAKRYQKDAVRVSTKGEEKQHLDIDYRALAVAPNDRENAIVNVLRYYEASNSIIFCGTRAMVNHMTSRFANRGFSVVALSGELSQNERTHALQAMRDGRARVCIATDVAARGIDLPNLELVIHADIPKSAQSLVHRSGRTGRAGRKGVCALIVPYNQRRRAESLLQRAKIKAEWGKPPTIEEIASRDDERLLGDEMLSTEIDEKEQALAARLAKVHSPEQIAAAFIRLYRKDQTAPEELLDHAPRDMGRERGRSRDGGRDRGERQRGPRSEGRSHTRDDFDNGVWFSLSIGHKQNAEPRWLLPMLCRAGGLTKRDIGAIRIDQGQTGVELDPKAVDRFLEAIGPDQTIEKNIVIKRLDSAPKRTEGGRSDGPSAGRGDRQGAGAKRSSDRARSSGRTGPDRRDQRDNRKDAPRRERPFAKRSDQDRSPEAGAKKEYKRDRPPAKGKTDRPPRQDQKPPYDRKPREDRKPGEDRSSAPQARRDNRPDGKAGSLSDGDAGWNALDASAKGPKRSSRKNARDDSASGAPARKSTGSASAKAKKKKLSPSKIRRAKAREQLRLKASYEEKSGTVSGNGLEPRKRKKTETEE